MATKKTVKTKGFAKKPEVILIPWIETPNSSNIVRFKYNEKDQELTVQFKSGGVYSYTTVTKGIYGGLMCVFQNKESVGAYISRNIIQNKTLTCIKLMG
jgi:hypothetical protein